jgi:lipopolysaccharide/colanic/teichoic acid biosynthesis glycosyltransferase
MRRFTDLLLTLPALVLLSPLLLLVAVAVKLESAGPAFFRQERVGRGMRLFRILKFRSMVADAHKLGPGVSGRSDPRITRIGRLLRASKLDELPQLINIIRGEMTLIGPRAEVPQYLPCYSDEEELLLEVRPGLTGPGQLYFTSHQAGELDGVEDEEAFYIQNQLHPKLAMDLEYLRTRSPARDLAILGRTAAVILGWRPRSKPQPDRQRS